jgi:hypothetical protein
MYLIIQNEFQLHFAVIFQKYQKQKQKSTEYFETS